MRRQTLVIPIALLLAVMAAAGVVLYTMNVKEEATTGGPTSTVVVASEDVPTGTELDPLIEQGKLVEQEIPKNYIVPGAVGSLEELQGTTVSQPLLEGEQILASRIVGARLGRRWDDRDPGGLHRLHDGAASGADRGQRPEPRRPRPRVRDLRREERRSCIGGVAARRRGIGRVQRRRCRAGTASDDEPAGHAGGHGR